MVIRMQEEKRMKARELLDDDFWVIVNGVLAEDPDMDLGRGDIVMLIPKANVGC